MGSGGDLVIYDAIGNIHRYKGIHPNLDTAIGFIETQNLKDLPLGKTEIDGKYVFCSVMEVDTKDEEEVSFEIHQNYMDIQIDITEKERLHLGKLPYEVLEFSKENDFGTVKTKKNNITFLEEGFFVCYFPKEAHQPTLSVIEGEKKKVKKCVFKVWMPNEKEELTKRF